MPSQNQGDRAQCRRHRRILIADDEELVRTGVATVVSRDGKYAICGMADDERRTTELAERTQPELLILDLFLGHHDGLALVKDLANRFPKTRILILSRSGRTYICAARAGRWCFWLLDEKCIGQTASSCD